MAVTTNPASPYGPIAEREFEAAAEHAKPALTYWLKLLPALDDDDFFNKASAAIFDAALTARFKGNWSAEDCRATAVYKEAGRRHLAAGHAAECTGDTIYSRAHAKVMRECGHTPSEPYPCDCGAEG